MTNTVSRNELQEAVVRELDRRAAVARKAEERATRLVVLMLVPGVLLSLLAAATMESLDRLFGWHSLDGFGSDWAMMVGCLWIVGVMVRQFNRWLH